MNSTNSKTKLGDVCHFVRGPFGGSLKKDIFVADGHAVFEQSHAIYNQFSDIRYFVDEVKFNEMKRFELKPNDMIMSCSGTMGKVAIAPEGIKPGIINQALLKLTPTDSLSVNYLKYWMESENFQTILKKHTQGAAIQNVVSVKVLKELEIPLPPLEDQKYIAAILDKADAVRRKRQQAIALTDQLLRSVFLDMFGDPVTNPKGWAQKTIGDCIKDGEIFELQDGNHGNDHPKVADFSNSGYPFVAANCVRDGKILYDNTYYLDESWLNKLRIGFAKPGDVLLTHKGTLGLTAILTDDYDTYIFSPQTTYYRLNLEALTQEYLVGYFNTDYFQRVLEKSGKQSTRAYVGITRQKDLPIFIPEIGLQQKYSEAHRSVRDTKERLRKAMNTDGDLFSSLTQKAFRGDLTKQDDPA